jgi:predicted HicB family RNase H-like nuclease
MSGVLQTPDNDMTAPTKNVTITLRLDPDEHETWVAAAEADGRTLSSWIRRQCSTSVAIETPKPRPKRKTR